MSGLKLKLDNSIQRYDDRSTKKEPECPLTNEEKEYLEKELFEYCKNAYVRRMTRSALKDHTETRHDLENSAYVFFKNILCKFDKKYYIGKIAEFDVAGAQNPKTLKSYFKWYFCTRIQLLSMETREQKKKKGVGPASIIDEVSYDEEYNGTFSEYNYNYDATGYILNELSKKNKNFQRFFQEHLTHGMTQKELKEEWKDDYNKLKQEYIKFKTDLRKKYMTVYKNEGRD